MNVALVKSDTLPHDRLFADARERLPGGGPVAKVREQAFADFLRLGLPHRRLEQWKYTDLRARLREVAPLADAPVDAGIARAAAAVKGLSIDGIRLVLVDGVFVASLSSDAGASGLRIRSLRAALGDAADARRDELLQASPGEAMQSLTVAMATDGVIVEVADGAELAAPLHVVHVATRSDTSAFTRSVLTIGRNARVTLVERFVTAPGAAAYQTYDALAVHIGDKAELQHVRLMEDELDAINISNASFTLGAKAKVSSFNLTRGASISRYQGVVTFNGEGAELATYGVNLLGGRRHGDTTLLVDHRAVGCTSRETFRAVLDQQGHSVFQGRIVVQPGAQHTDGKMMTRALLLSDDAEVDNKPELEIFADDVSCGHGATAGALDEGLLFYLRARGLPEQEAQALLIEAFVGEAIEAIADDTLREIALEAARHWLAARD